MSQRVRLIDCILSSLPGTIGLVKGDVPRIAEAVNESQEILVNCEEANEAGWHGSWSEMAFSVDRKFPYITCPRGVSRIEAFDACNQPVPLRNQFSEYMDFGDGRMPKTGRWRGRCDEWNRAGFTRNNSALFTDISNPPQNIQIFALNTADTISSPQTGAIPRVLVQGIDQNGRIVTSMDGNNLVQGEFVTLASPYAMTVNQFKFITGIQKDVTQGEVQIYQSDPQWGIAEILLTMEPTETTAWYRRYYLNGLPRSCCPSFRPIRINEGAPTCGCPYDKREFVQVTALAKLDLIPVVAPTDYCLIQSVQALTFQCQANRFNKMDDTSSSTKAAEYHAMAIKVLRGQGISEDGKNNVSVSFAPFGRGGRNRANLQMR